MKKFAIILALMMFNFQLSVYAATSRRTVRSNKKVVKVSNQQKKPTEKLYNVYDDSNFLLKYNIDDLDSAPWKNGGKRRI